MKEEICNNLTDKDREMTSPHAVGQVAEDEVEDMEWEKVPWSAHRQSSSQ